CAILNNFRFENEQELSKIDGLAYQLCFLRKCESNTGITRRACYDFKNELIKVNSESAICQKTKTQLQIERNYLERTKNELSYEKISFENELQSCKLESVKIRVKQESRILDLENAKKKLTDLVSDLENELNTLKREKSDVFILVIPYRVDRSYMQSSDGSSQISATINAPENNYAKYATHALVNGKLHIFGGTSDYKKIARLDDCTFNELTVRLNEERRNGQAALSIENGEKALICFGFTGNISKTCEIFDGSTTVSTFAADWSHRNGGLGLYKNQPASVGCYFEEHQKAETLSASGWIALPNHPKRISRHSLVGLENESMLLIGGADYGNGGVSQSGILATERRKLEIKSAIFCRPTMLDLPFTSADQFIISDTGLLTPFKDWISTK
ncbi:unnamed protein product, partial [Oikopleura dioica]